MSFSDAAMKFQAIAAAASDAKSKNPSFGADDAGLFDNGNKLKEETGGTKRGIENANNKERERRVKLKSYDAAAAQLLNPYGESIAKHMNTAELWDAVETGNQIAVFHSELAATKTTGGDYRVGIGISRTAEALKAAIAALKSDNLKKLIKEEFYEAAIDEATGLEPHLNVLDLGKASQVGTYEAKGFAKYRSMAGETKKPTNEEIGLAAEALLTWFGKNQTPLRAVLAILAANGCFWSGHIAEKVARGWMTARMINKKDAVAAITTRLEGARTARTSSGTEDDAAGLNL